MTRSAHLTGSLWFPREDFIVAFYLAFAFLVPTAAAMIRTRALPVWLGWVTPALGILILSPVGWIFFVFGLSLWTLLVSILLFLGGRAPTSQGVT